ncbi:hypothetical protein [Alistipes communis]|jgi:hypothetical protein|uniref:Uncharacterized protein n=1 Tax=Alistipes communis TaxID=2585118 RepID=A0A3D3YMZ4_9BACT|nr:hypothetical protein [Alistipes communis]BBL03042.1 hypothetical protein A5CBH24_03550 [Alistipes communis]DAW67513.1 MAG TPA: protein of unknown function (DUF3333) [Caudoviricetes sp.]HCP59040.1 hypothetical protein [Alistipes communis]
MEEKDITLADMILASLMSESEHIMLYVIHEKATDEAQAQRVILSLCSYGAAHETDIHLEKTDKTANLIALGGARYIYEQERLKERYNKLSMLDIELSIQEKRRNKWLSISAILISFVALVISIVSLFVS